MSQMNIDLEGWDLHRAARKNRFDIAGELIARGDDNNARDSKPSLMTNTTVQNAILHFQT